MSGSQRSAGRETIQMSPWFRWVWIGTWHAGRETADQPNLILVALWRDKFRIAARKFAKPTNAADNSGPHPSRLVFLPVMPRLLLLAAAGLLAAAPAVAAPELTIERIFASPDLSGPSLRQAELSPAGDRVTFIRARDEDRDLLDLWEYHIADEETRILVAADAVVAEEGELSAEEQARRERARIAGLRGIVEYRWSGDGRFLIFPLGGNIYVLDLSADNPEVRQVTEAPEFDIDPQVSPDGRYVAFVRERNLWLAEIETGSERQLTEDGDEVIANGLAEFIAQEEMGRSTGFWWSPDSRRIAFLRTDESAIEPTLRFEIQADRITMVEQRYPFTGTPNVTTTLASSTWSGTRPTGSIWGRSATSTFRA